MNKHNYPRKLHKNLSYQAGRDATGKVSMRHKGGRHKRMYRIIDFNRSKHDILARVDHIAYDPNRGVDIALVVYEDGDKRYILAPDGLQEGASVISGEKAEMTIGNALPVSHMPIGTQVHNIELTPGKGGQMARGAGNYATIMGKEGEYVRMKLPSGEVRMVRKECYATIGQLSNTERKHRNIGKAGTKRHMGVRPTVRGVAQDPGSHPHGGGEGRSGIGMPSPKTPWGKKAMGVRTRRKKSSDRLIIERRK
ncbi:MAG: 50S ribosomal protein L2 [Microgenomates group bacterium GW2011_GWC1_41_8]|uniref:Large ribosomal subunit protein uL2 n=3 Tax=Candidatus Roizmaniibacteriota TaxID=1752723 RepID=A0A0G0X361_9BACT|nr:MAG: 50S ribosomal protein L2 [Candidatus Roizmanbacteria bacterium GW2011_GWB1_40_7]KKR94556.1 MAG: 50S ribosomal protein L2 [Candidatus Roizmanbacteria bacterium GW2011_GWA1_41_13]KKS19484.1 MAG: 50S ribosomal protein L2 [Candidatus Roizmanbacteria bacterium GW2011_GWC2_41_7]KKS24243.1 MAG: 50S ribosomal protein L2 [Microgenomates group bacterium GW2011_GWC1_41_8]OGK48424.1 MAG: 50S ribosomal protein L2 [Candidatus Roizmanbacteria bacterium RIFCSPLOWO2_01_FULL_40_14]